MELAANGVLCVQLLAVFNFCLSERVKLEISLKSFVGVHWWLC